MKPAPKARQASMKRARGAGAHHGQRADDVAQRRGHRETRAGSPIFRARVEQRSRGVRGRIFQHPVEQRRERLADVAAR